MKDPFVPVDIFHERYDSSLVEEFALLAVPFIRQDNFEALVQEGQFAEAVGKDIETEINILEYFVIWFEGDLCAPAPSFSYDI